MWKSEWGSRKGNRKACSWGQVQPHPPERTAFRPGSASRWAPCDCCSPPQSFRSIPRYYFFFALLGAMESLAALATRNFTTVLAAILMAAPVLGSFPCEPCVST